MTSRSGIWSIARGVAATVVTTSRSVNTPTSRPCSTTNTQLSCLSRMSSNASRTVAWCPSATAVGVAVAINVADMENDAIAPTGSTITSEGASIQAVMKDVGGDKTHKFAAKATSGGSGGDTGVAGSFALIVLMLPTVTRTSEEILRTIPDPLREASLATALRRLRHVVFPLLRPITVVLVVLSVIFSMRTFDIVWALTRGQIREALEMVSTLIVRTAFDYHEFGVAAALAVVLFVIILVLAIAQVALMERGAEG